MDTITYSEARSRFAETLDKVCDDHAPVVITRRNAASVVMMSLADYRALEETTYLLRSAHATLKRSFAVVMRSSRSGSGWGR